MQTILNIILKLETALLCLLLLAMVLLASVQIVLRGVFSGGFLWADPLLRYLVLWSGLLGGVLATAKGKHIALDLAGYLIPKRFRPAMEACTYLFSVLVSGVLSWASIVFLRNEMEFGAEALFNLPSWFWNGIFPVAFGLMTLRFLILFYRSVRRCFTPAETRDEAAGAV